MPSSSTNSSGAHRSEKHKQRRLTLPRSNPIEQTSQILTPELPFGLQKRASVRSQLTSITHDTQSTTSEGLSHVMATKVNASSVDGTEDYDEDEHVVGETPTSLEARSSFFIPGITGKARCLQADKRVNRKHNQSLLVTESIDEKASRAESSSRASAKRSEQSASGSRISHDCDSNRSVLSDDNKSGASAGIEHANLLYGAVVDSIQARRNEGLNDLGEEDFQRMLSLLQPNEGEPSLRQQVSSIRSLLSDYERKELLKQRKHKKRHDH